LDEDEKDKSFQDESKGGLIGDLYRKKLLPIVEWIFKFGLINSETVFPWDFIRASAKASNIHLNLLSKGTNST
jgi:hypothetical protein